MKFLRKAAIVLSSAAVLCCLSGCDTVSDLFDEFSSCSTSTAELSKKSYEYPAAEAMVRLS